MDAHLLLGKLLLETGRTEEAEIHLGQAAVARPNDPKVQVLARWSQRLNRKDAMAGDTLKNALRANPASPEVRMELVNDHVRKKEVDLAVRVLDQGLEAKPDELEFLRARGELFVARKEFSKAKADFEQILRLRPGAPVGYLEMGKAFPGPVQTGRGHRVVQEGPGDGKRVAAGRPRAGPHLLCQEGPGRRPCGDRVRSQRGPIPRRLISSLLCPGGIRRL